MIPSNITKEHILQTLLDFESKRHLIPKSRTSRDYDLVFNNNRYPPKYVISVANLHANGELLPSSSFNGGLETNSFLKSRGFTIEIKNFISSYSWYVLSSTVFLKQVDKTIFKYGMCVIPRNLSIYFFKDNEMFIDITLLYRNTIYNAHVSFAGFDEPTARLIWDSEFTCCLKESIKSWPEIVSDNGISRPYIRFEKDSEVPARFYIDVVDPQKVFEDSIRERKYDLEYQTSIEGGVKYYYTKKYERDPQNREQAIEYHGTRCKVCGFNFSDFYGQFGEGYIEIHHIIPLSSLEEEIPVDPKTDLVPVCSNCHRMLHHSKDHVLTIDELKSLIMQK